MRVQDGIHQGAARVVLTAAVLLGVPASGAVQEPSVQPAEAAPAPQYFRIGSPWLDPEVALAPVRPQQTSHAVAIVEVVTLDVGIWSVDKLRGATYANVGWDSWGQNLRKGWIVDTDDFWMNGLLHPLSGSYSFSAPRSLGVGFYGSFGYAFASSLLWETFAETEAPSIFDQANTPFGGALIGEVLFRLHHLILDAGGAHPGPWRRILAFVVAPIAGANELIFQDRYRGPLQLPISWIGDFSMGAVITARSTDERTGEQRTGMGPWALFEVHVLHGVPGTPGLRLDQPFEHFDLDASVSATTNDVQPTLSLLIRGLLLGEPVGPSRGFGGLWGLFTSYDFVASRWFRETGFGIGPGISAVQRWGGIDLYGTALAEWVPLGEGGLTLSTRDRDYQYGTGGRGLLELRMDIGDRVTLKASGRAFLLTDLQSRGRHEDIAHTRFGLTVRLWGPHAIGLASDGSFRSARDDTGDVQQRAWTFSVQYTVLSGW